ncbi:MAG TPA: hypothetical protein VMU01_06110 [Rhizomicrobium sp.]|nr:hypothetical protein [Rhizomicrobium sp.]
MKRFGATLIGLVLCIGSAHASDRWICKFRFENYNDPTLFEGPVSIEGHKLLVYSGDFTSRPNPYDIVEDTPAGVIAIWHKPSQITVATIDRRNLSFKMHLVSVSGDYEERWSGTCRANH